MEVAIYVLGICAIAFSACSFVWFPLGFVSAGVQFVGVVLTALHSKKSRKAVNELKGTINELRSIPVIANQRHDRKYMKDILERDKTHDNE